MTNIFISLFKTTTLVLQWSRLSERQLHMVHGR